MFSLQPFFEKYDITPDDMIIVGVSGWVDSMVLLKCLEKIHPHEKIIVTHVNHGLRGEESDLDATFVEDYSQKNGFIFELSTPDIQKLSKEKKESIETFAREERRRIFEEIRTRYGAKYVILAHHQDDSIETILLNFFRGTKLRWLAGIPEKNDHILRPFLTLSKKEILTFAKEQNIPYREDSSNADTRYLRNQVRNSIIPEIEKINPEFRKNLSDFANYTKEIELYFTELLGPFLHQRQISEVSFHKLPPFLQKTLIERIYSGKHKTSVGLSEGNISEMVRFFLEANGGTKKELGKLCFRKKERIISW